jgi:hypothetical protein
MALEKTAEQLNDMFAEIAARLDILEDAIEELRYAGPSSTRPVDYYDEDDYDIDPWDDVL